MAPRFSPWLVPLRSDAGSEFTLVCVPFAGGSAQSFRTWPQRLPAWLEVLAVDLPGRGLRFAEPLSSDGAALAAACAEAIAPLLQRPFAVFGHSMGALLAFELVQQLERRARNARVLMVSGQRPPHVPAARPPIHDLPEARFIEELMKYEGCPPEVMANAELRALFLPILRNDFAVCETYSRPPAAPRLECPIFALCGERDPGAGAADLDAWRDLTRAGFELEAFNGGHFFIREQEAQVLGSLSRRLAAALE